jgi:hypothetical protein
MVLGSVLLIPTHESIIFDPIGKSIRQITRTEQIIFVCDETLILFRKEVIYCLEKYRMQSQVNK